MAGASWKRLLRMRTQPRLVGLRLHTLAVKALKLCSGSPNASRLKGCTWYSMLGQGWPGSLRVTRRIVQQPALAKYQPVEWKPGLQYQSDEDLARLAGDIATTIFHPVGTTKMGTDDDPMAVLDARMRVRGVAGLRVVDGGAMPTITSGNTNSPTLMIAEKAAEWILRDARQASPAAAAVPVAAAVTS